ncbi:hypothetical protein GGTG_00702 [Gaeumannomyces tritici R3-111a-1]|uniref:RRM domain-containing protein n=1 Tax=Gaeumannomyces tritici (strain R3-111a-1) TaxID=644352 RepID=J3NHG5_GAET3|nr:hypothetical protein GGTG_00702 [Gaeumannomyces tritici R3-111a-1]EJT80708.1 hypothetical protein GGTG_00702 [Gaeumannomyces tritici R3-111a-1]
MAAGKDEPSSPASSSPAPEAAKSSKKRKPAPADEIEVDLNLPEPPSKKARRALKKGKPLKTKSSSKRDKKRRAEGRDDDDDDEDLPDQLKSDVEGGGGGGGGGSGSSKKERSKYGVWIGNLRFTTTRADLFRWLVESSGGAIAEDAITRVNLPLSKLKREGRGEGGSGDAAAAGQQQQQQAPPRENKGFAYVDFATFEACIAAIALSESEMNGRKLLIKDCKSFEGRPAATAAAASATTNGGSAGDDASAAAAAAAAPASTNSKIYVGNLPFDANEDSLWAHFDKCGAIQWAKVATFEDSGKCKGYGWVKFAEPAGAQWAVQGFVRIKELVETEADFVGDDGDEDGEGSDNDDDDNGDDDDDSDADDAKAQKKAQKKKRREAAAAAAKPTRMRKWWVNKFRGRTLTIQLAEDDQTRYKKRFGKDAPKGVRTGKPQGRTAPDANRPDRPASDAAVGGDVKKAISYHNDINVARLTGAAVAPQGKKVTFE